MATVVTSSRSMGATTATGMVLPRISSPGVSGADHELLEGAQLALAHHGQGGEEEAHEQEDRPITAGTL